MEHDKARQLMATFARLKEDRLLIDDAYYRRAYEYTMPYRGIGFINRDNDGTTNALVAKNYQGQIYDSTATDAVHTLAASLVTGLVPKNSKWFSLGVLGIDNSTLNKQSRNWLQDAATVLHQHIHASNFDIVVNEFFQDMGIVGYAGLFVEELEDAEEAQLFRFHEWIPYEVLVMDSTGDGAVDTIFRQLDITLSQAVAMYGLENLPEDLQQSYESNPDDKKRYTFVHVIRPRKNGRGQRATAMPYESIHISKKGQKIVRESGFNELPCIVPRWTVLPNTDYALGPINEALPDIKTVNEVVKMYLTALEYNIAGTFVAKNDGSINPNTTRIGPRRIIFASNVENIRALTSNSDPGAAAAEINRLQRQIQKAMKVDMLGPIEGQYQTATQVQANVNIIRQQLGPIYGRMVQEFCEPLIERCLAIAMRQGVIPPPPEELIGAGLEVQYQSPLARAQRMEEISSMEIFEQYIATNAQVFPDLLDIYDYDAAGRARAALLDIPADVIRSEQDVAQIRRDEQEEQERQEAMMMAMQGQPEA